MTMCDYCRGEVAHRFPCNNEGEDVEERSILDMGRQMHGGDGVDREAGVHARRMSSDRMAGFIAWLQSKGCCSQGMRHCLRYETPEAAMRACPGSPSWLVNQGPRWVADRLHSAGRRSFSLYFDTLADVDAMLRSPEWHAMSPLWISLTPRSSRDDAGPHATTAAGTTGAPAAVVDPAEGL